MLVKAAAAAAALASAACSAEVTGPSDWPSAVPFWPQYPSRRVTVLNGTWQFGYSDGNAVDPVTIAYKDIATPNATSVPSAFDVTEMGLPGPHGNAFYRSVHACTPGASALLKFGAVNFYARVFVDGADIGNHTAGGYTPFQMVAPPCGAGGTRELLVVVNNQQNRTLSPTYTGGDFFFYSGIIRPVIVTELPPTSPDKPFWIDALLPVTVDYARGLIDVRVVLNGLLTGNNVSSSAHLTVSINGGPPSPSTEFAVVNGTAVIGSVAVPNFKLWRVGADNREALFTVTVTETASGDAVTVRTGIRSVSIDPSTSRIAINGQVVKLLGFNRHTMWPDTGAAVTQEQEVIDVGVVQGVSANYIRGAHYPQSQSWLDRLDEAGIVLWEEALGPGTSTKDFHDPWFMANHLQAVRSMATTSFAHPSVIIHGFFNEGPSNDPDACVGYAASAQAIRDVMGTSPMRLITWANNHLELDKCISYEDIISFNSYPGWYDHPGDIAYVAPYWEGKIAWAASTWPSKAVTISETGGGGIYEWLNTSAPYPGPFWSQAYQSNLVTTDAAVIAADDRVSGLTLWQLTDIKVEPSAGPDCGPCVYQQPIPDSLSVPWNCTFIDTSCGRPGGENHKGTVDFWRRTKIDYPLIAKIYANYTKASA